MSKIVVLLLSVFPLFPQQLPIQILCGSATDQYFVGTSKPPATCSLGAGISCTYTDANLPAMYPTLRYGLTVHYRIPVQAGVYIGFLDFVEPNKTAAGQRLMSITVNGETSDPIDVFALAPGDDVLYRLPFLAVAQVGIIDVTITGVAGNAILSGIEIAGAPLTAGLLPGTLTAEATRPGGAEALSAVLRDPAGHWAMRLDTPEVQ